jgi:hypothetical protein
MEHDTTAVNTQAKSLVNEIFRWKFLLDLSTDGYFSVHLRS